MAQTFLLVCVAACDPSVCELATLLSALCALAQQGHRSILRLTFEPALALFFQILER